MHGGGGADDLFRDTGLGRRALGRLGNARVLQASACTCGRCTSRNIPSRSFPGKLSLAEVFRLRPVISFQKENTRFVPAKTFRA